MTGVTVNTNSGDFKVPGGKSWGTQFGPDGEVLVLVHGGPFKELLPDERGMPVMAATGEPIAQFSEVEAIFFTEHVTSS